MADVTLRHVYKVYDGGVRAVNDFDLEIKDKEFVVFVGPSGCGKSTTLRMIAGLEEITAGQLFIDGELMNEVEPKNRDIAMVFQSYALYPHMTVYDNMAFGLKLRHTPKAEIDQRVKAAAEILEISELLTRKPKALSGGQRQRVALGRTIVRQPKVFLLDEPLSNLDAKLRVSMRSEITKLHEKLETTFIYVTHDQTEAMTMGNRIVVMKDGFIQQADTPITLFEDPSNLFVATFLGSPQMNIIEAILFMDNGTLKAKLNGCDDMVVTFPDIKAKQLASKKYIGKKVLLGIRPEHVRPNKGDLKVYVDVVEHLGDESILYTKIELNNVNTKEVAESDNKVVEERNDFEGMVKDKVREVMQEESGKRKVIVQNFYSLYDEESRKRAMEQDKLSKDVKATPIDVYENNEITKEDNIFTAKKTQIIIKMPFNSKIRANTDTNIEFDMNHVYLFDYQTHKAIMGIPHEDEIPVTINGNVLTMGEQDITLNDEFLSHLLDTAFVGKVHLAIKPDYISREEIANSMKIQVKLEFIDQKTDYQAVYFSLKGLDGYYAMKVENDTEVKLGEVVDLYLPYSRLFVYDKNHNKANSREVVYVNQGHATLKSEYGKTEIKFGNNVLTFPQDEKYPDGKYIIRFKQDRLLPIFNSKMLKQGYKNPRRSNPQNVIKVSAYDEDVLGNKLLAYVQVKGFDNYASFVVDNNFSVYKMPKFDLYVNRDAFELIPLKK